MTVAEAKTVLPLPALLHREGLGAHAKKSARCPLLKPMDEQLKLKSSDRHGEWAQHSDFFDQATNDVRAIKRAWRDTTMHLESNYDESGARKALDAVTSFFVHIAEKLDQDGKVYDKPLVFPMP